MLRTNKQKSVNDTVSFPIEIAKPRPGGITERTAQPTKKYHKKKMRGSLQLHPTLFFILTATTLLFYIFYSNTTETTTTVTTTTVTTGRIRSLNNRDRSPNNGTVITTSIVIVTRDYPISLVNLLHVLTHQKPPTNFEVIVVDNGCVSATNAVVESFVRTTDVPMTYIPLCNNSGHGVGRYEGAKSASESTEWVLFLKDDLVITNTHFVRDLVRVGDGKGDAAGAVGCKMVRIGAGSSNKVIDARGIGIMWRDGSVFDYNVVEGDDFDFARPVDYVSGACLLVRKDAFVKYGGFDKRFSSSYYQDIDLQMHIQHDLGKKVWFQPFAVGQYKEAHNGSLDDSESGALASDDDRKVFTKKWKGTLLEYSDPPFQRGKTEQHLDLLRASDVRARDDSKGNILYIDDAIPKKSSGSGFGRALDNLSMLIELGHRVTLLTTTPSYKHKCDEDCMQSIKEIGIEALIDEKIDRFLMSRVGLYDIVIISRPANFYKTYQFLRELYMIQPFTVAYDCEALIHRREEKYVELLKTIPFPSARYGKLQGVIEILDPNKPQDVKKDKDLELAFLSMADIVITVSQIEKDVISQLSPTTNVLKIGHVMNLDKVTKSQFHDRKGILFLAAFHGSMYYNGDAIWYFINEVYPLVLQESPIPLTIAGRDIPEELIQIVENSASLSKHITFHESPDSVEPLYEKTRFLIAPHLYGAGIQYKISEAVSLGVPVVMSKFTADCFSFEPEDNVGCVGIDNDSFSSCILELHANEAKWKAHRDSGLEWIRRTHNHDNTMQKWSHLVRVGMDVIATVRNNGGAMNEALMEQPFLTTKIQRVLTNAEKNAKLVEENEKRIATAAKRKQRRADRAKRIAVERAVEKMSAKLAARGKQQGNETKE